MHAQDGGEPFPGAIRNFRQGTSIAQSRCLQTITTQLAWHSSCHDTTLFVAALHHGAFAVQAHGFAMRHAYAAYF